MGEKAFRGVDSPDSARCGLERLGLQTGPQTFRVPLARFRRSDQEKITSLRGPNFNMWKNPAQSGEDHPNRGAFDFVSLHPLEEETICVQPAPRGLIKFSRE